jgi:predicted dehydrogenase
MSVLRLGVIGAGQVARKHLDVISDIQGISVSGVVSRTRGTAERLISDYAIQNVFEGIDELVESGCSDALLVLVSVEEMFEVGKNALKYGLPVFFEKPPSLYYEEAKILADIASDNNVKSMVGFNRRYYSVFHQGLDVIKRHGRLLGVAIEGHERFWKLTGGLTDIARDRWIYANNIHMIDLLRFFGGEINRIHSISASYLERIGDQFVAAVEFESGVLGSYIAHWYSPEGWSVRLFGEGVTVVCKPLEQGYWVDKHFNQYSLLPDVKDVDYKAGFFRQMEAFEHLVRNDSLEWPGQSLQQSIKTMRLVGHVAPNAIAQ